MASALAARQTGAARGLRAGLRLAGHAGVVAGWLGVAGCGEEPRAIVSVVCRDPQSNACVPCPGTVDICVDPINCVAVNCVADVLFNPKDATATDAGSGDGSAGDGEISDSDASGEVKVGLDAAAEVVAVDAFDATLEDAKDAVDASVCTPGALQCSGNSVQVCQFTGTPPKPSWVFDKGCAADQQCQSGLCGCKDPCPALNLVQCLPGVAALRTCQLTPSSCLSWAMPVACSPGQVCQNGMCQVPSPCGSGCPSGKVCDNGVCIDPPCQPACPSGQNCKAGVCVPKGGGTLTCAQVTACIGNCPGSDSSCPDSCKGQGSDSALSLLASYQGCLKAVCKPLADQGKIAETMLCAFTSCFSEQAACVGSGSTNCKAISDCFAVCGSSATCSSACNNQASQQGGKDYYGLLTCVDNLCGNVTGEQQLSCAQQACKSLWDKCFAGAPALYTTCLQVAQCQGKCGGDTTCAKGCKAAASPAAQAAVDAFITCRENKCGTYCANTANPNCGACIEQYCGLELANCSY